MDKFLNEFKNYITAQGFDNTYSGNIKKFLKFCEDNNINLLELTYNDFSKYIIWVREKKFSNGYINNLLKAVRSFYTFLTDSGQVDSSKLETIKKFHLFKEERKIKESLTKKELEDLIGTAITILKKPRPTKLKALLYFLFYTGVRRNELFNLKRKEINLIEGKAIIRVPTKNKQERVVFFPPKVCKQLERYFRIEAEIDNAFNMNKNKITHLINKLNMFVPRGRHVTAHIFRHSFANMLASNDINIRVAQKLLGHKSMQSTLIYYDPDIKIVEKIYREKIKEEN